MTDVHSMIAELTRPHVIGTQYQTFRDGELQSAYHYLRTPALLVQLNNADPANTGAAFRATPGSRPPTSIEAIDTLAHIDNEAATWVRKLGHDDPGDTIACVQKVYSLAPSAEFCGRQFPVLDDKRKVICCDTHRIARAIHAWWTAARVVSGWDSAAWAPNNTCPVDGCGERRSLRIRVEEKTALCTNCRETWDAGSIGILAEHIRAENGETILGEAS